MIEETVLLALCQTILALPLVLLWAGLKWRRRRRMRRLTVAGYREATG
jgi:hypothetical protein